MSETRDFSPLNIPSSGSSPRTTHRWAANGILIVVTIIWGATFSLTKNALNDISVFPYLTLRFIIATLALVGIALCIPRVRTAFTRRTVVSGAFLGTLLYGGYALQTLGLTTTTPATSGFLTGLSVVMVPLLAAPILQSRPHRRNGWGVCLSVVGLALLTGVNFHNWRLGDFFGIGCSLFLALQIVYTERLAKGENALALTTVQISVLTIWCSLTTTLPGQRFSDADTWSNGNVWSAVVVCGLLGTAFAYVAQTHFQQSTSATATAVIFTTEPVFAAVIGWLTFSDALPPLGQLGCLLIFMSMIIADENISLAHWFGRFRRR